MAIALTLLVLTLGFVLFHERDFGFPEEVQLSDDTQQASLAATVKNVRQKHPGSKPHGNQRTRREAVVTSAESADMGPNAAATSRASALLEVEVVAANSNRKLRLRSNGVQVNLERASPLSQAEPNDGPRKTTLIAARSLRETNRFPQRLADFKCLRFEADVLSLEKFRGHRR